MNAPTQIKAQPNPQSRENEMLQEEMDALEAHERAVQSGDGSFASEARIAGAWDRYVRLIHRDRPRAGDAPVLDYFASHREDGRVRRGF